MLYIVRYFLVGILLCIPLLSFASIKSDVAALEDAYEIPETDMYTMIYVRELSEKLTEQCTPEDILFAKTYTKKITDILKKRYASLSRAKTLADSRRIYEILTSINMTRINRLSEKNYCILKYIVYQVQQYLRDAHLEILDDTDIIKDFNGFESSTIYGGDVKKAYMDMLIEDLSTYRDDLGVTYAFSIKNASFKNNLSSEQKELLERSQKIMEFSLYKVLYDLKEEGLFDANDISLLQDKIMFEYVEACGLVNGKYEIKETLTSKGEHISYAIEALHLRVNLCPNFFVLRDLPEIYEKIITHELGHHFYYYHDETRNNGFVEVCWDTMDKRNTVCKDDDFVTPYARTLSVEDYSEHFMHWFLDILPAGQSTKMRLKSTYFDNL